MMGGSSLKKVGCGSFVSFLGVRAARALLSERIRFGMEGEAGKFWSAAENGE